MTSSLLFLSVCAVIVFAYRLGFNDALDEVEKIILAKENEFKTMKINVNERNVIDPANRVN